MKPSTCSIAAVSLFLTTLVSSLWASEPLPTTQQVRRIFEKPARDYSTGPLWVWNDMLSEDQIKSTLRDLAAQNVKQVWVHPRPGLMTPYLDKDWFRLWKLSLKEAARLDMNVWIYDENSYPSGFAGGLVPEAMPESRGRGIIFRETSSVPPVSKDLVAVYRVQGSSVENISDMVHRGEKPQADKFLQALQVWDEPSPWHGNRWYVNLLTPGVTEKFLELTLEPYRREVGKEFGKRIPGVFTDEPNIRPAGSFPWCEDLPTVFQKRWGYNLLDHLPSLERPVGDWRKVRHNYFQVLHELFVERWARPYHDYCERNNLQFTGHYWDHNWPGCVGVPDNMAMYAWHQTPAIDCLMNQYAENTHAQFGNVRMVRELSSVANQLGAKRTLCEIYGAAGWDLRFEDMKRIGDWLQVLGVNTLNEHLSYVTIRGARKRDHPQSFSYHEPWWNAYHLNANYFTRVSAALSQGQQVNKVLVLQPTTTAWMYQGDGKRLGQIGDSFFKLLMALEAAQVEYDLASEDLIARHGKPGTTKLAGSLEPAGLQIGKREYVTLIVPPYTENLNRETQQLLDGIKIKKLIPAGMPTRLDGQKPSDAEEYALPVDWSQSAWMDSIIPDLKKVQVQAGFDIQRALGDRGILFHHRRELADGEILFLVNTSAENPSSGRILSRFKGVEEWDLDSGERKPYVASPSEAGIQAEFKLPPSGSLLLVLSDRIVPAEASIATRDREVSGSGKLEVVRLQPNVLTVDYVDVSAGGETRTNIYFYQANQFAWRKNGMPRNPWDSAVQYKSELISKTFPPDSGFEATYRFTIRDRVPANLAIVIERTDLYEITVNGKPAPKSRTWWLDRAFGRLDIASLAQTGQNKVTLRARPFTMFHELEPAYVLGDFALKPAASGFVIAAPEPLRISSTTATPGHTTNPENTAWLTRGVGFTEDDPSKGDLNPSVTFQLQKPARLAAIRIWQYSETHVRDNTGRGVKRCRITGSTEVSMREGLVDLGTFELARGSGSPEGPQVIKVASPEVRFLRFDILANHNGVEYPVKGNLPDNGFVGLSEVQFIDALQEPIGASVAAFSSELQSHERFAGSLVDRSGLESPREGWNRLGMPFYSWDVAYRQTFDIGRKSGRYLVSLPDWCGSVAQVRVNGKPAGWILTPPYECDVTSQLRRGENKIEVAVIGTLKNTLGPHHGNPKLGSAWPRNFQTGPENGPPAGQAYHTVAYGLFAPFQLKQRTPSDVVSSPQTALK